MEHYKDEAHGIINLKNISSLNSDFLEELAINLLKLINEQDLRINNRIKSIEEKISDIEINISSASNNTTMSEDEVETNNMMKEATCTFPGPFLGHRSYFAELCTNVSLPGLRYVAEGGEPWLHRFIWIFLQLIAILISSSYIQNAYYRWKSSPVVQSVTNTLTKVNEIPFPATTLCEHISLNEEYNQWEIMTRCMTVENGTSWLCSNMELNMFLLSLDIDPITFNHLSEEDRVLYEESLGLLRTQSNHTISGEEYYRYVNNISVGYTKWKCLPENNASLCAGTLSPIILVPHEIVLLGKPTWYLHKCQTFNGFQHGPHYEDSEKQNNEHSNQKRTNPHQQYCKWTPENMFEKSCKVGTNLVYTDEYVQFSNERTDKTFFVVIHNPADYPNLANMKAFGIQRLKLFKMKIIPKLVTAANDLTNVEVRKRGCLFSYEKSLSMFNFYTYQNCYLECQITCALSNCGCVPHSICILNSSLPVCTKKCEIDFCECDCPPDCTSLSYDADTDVEKSPIPSVKMEYKNFEFPSTFRYSVTSPAEFVAYSLGIFGVFNGFSVMLLWEIFYWMTLRLWSTVKRTVTPTTP